jgi:hypothetical protein
MCKVVVVSLAKVLRGSYLNHSSITNSIEHLMFYFTARTLEEYKLWFCGHVLYIVSLYLITLAFQIIQPPSVRYL